MRRKRGPENDQQRSDRLDQESEQRREQTAVEDKALDAAVRRSIKQYGA